MKYYKFFNIALICEELGIKKTRIYLNFSGALKKDTISDEEKKSIGEFLKPHTIKMFEFLGFKITIE